MWYVVPWKTILATCATFFWSIHQFDLLFDEGAPIVAKFAHLFMHIDEGAKFMECLIGQTLGFWPCTYSFEHIYWSAPLLSTWHIYSC